MQGLPNIFNDLQSGDPGAESFHALLDADGLRIERIVSRGHASPEGFWYQQVWDEWVLLLKGRARLRFERQDPFDLAVGSFAHIPSGTRHRVDWTDPAELTVWLAVHWARVE